MKPVFEFVEWDAQSQQACDSIKSICYELQNAIEDSLSASRERSLALTKLEECFMWVGKSIRHDQANRLAD